MEVIVDGVLMLLSRAATAIQARVQAARERDAARTAAARAAVEAREAARNGREP